MTCVPVQAERMSTANEAGTAHVIQLRTTHGLPTESVAGLTSAEEHSIVRFYTSMLAAFALRKTLPPKVAATAITFLKRFYLDHSNMEHDALRIAPTCLYIACKVRAPPAASTGTCLHAWPLAAAIGSRREVSAGLGVASASVQRCARFGKQPGVYRRASTTRARRV